VNISLGMASAISLSLKAQGCNWRGKDVSFMVFLAILLGLRCNIVFDGWDAHAKTILAPYATIYNSSLCRRILITHRARSPPVMERERV
jgi:hypothetical protein